MRRTVFALFTVFVMIFVMLPVSFIAQDQSASDKEPKAIKLKVEKALRQDTSKPLREIIPLKAGKARKFDNPMNFVKRDVPENQADGALQAVAFPNVPVTAGLNFEGVGEGLPGYNVNVAPPGYDWRRGWTNHKSAESDGTIRSMGQSFVRGF